MLGLFTKRRTQALTEREVQELVRPVGQGVRAVPVGPSEDEIPQGLRELFEKPSVFSEDERPELTREQKDTLDKSTWRYDEVGPCEMRRNGWLTVRMTSYDAGGREVTWQDIAPDGEVYDIENQEDAA
jgi:hypothetical protein